MTVELREITAETVRAICRLTVAPDQEAFVAPNAVSIAEAYFEPNAWFRAIYADGEPVGFVMLEDDSVKEEYVLWRPMIAEGFQGRSYGRRAVGVPAVYDEESMTRLATEVRPLLEREAVAR